MTALHPIDAARASACQLAAFARFAAKRTARDLPTFAALHAFSTREAQAFWTLFLEWSGAICEGDRAPAIRGSGVEDARFFPGLKLSYAENLLAERSPEEEAALAVIACDEQGGRTALTRSALRARVHSVAAALDARGLKPGDRVVAVARNTADTLVACLASTSLGAAWSSVGLDVGLEAALSRFEQLSPALLVLHRSTSSSGARVAARLDRLVAGLPSLRSVVLLDDEPADPAVPVPQAGISELAREGGTLEQVPARRFPFDHPLFILFSSGTTGPPKCIVHGHGGTLVEHLKEHRLHCDLGPRDRLLFQTSAGWMMWNWMISALACGTCLVLYDGSVAYPEKDALLDVLGREQVTVFGTSPAYLQYLIDAGVEARRGQLASLRELHSTGSVLYPHLHQWAKEHLSPAPLQSISGGTDIIGCFVMGSPWSEVRAGESGCVGLGHDVRAWSPEGVEREGRGELICAAPFPSRPVGLFADPDGTRFHRSWFQQHEGVWAHGDLVELSASGGARILGRCDGVLNIHGVRLGPGEIYQVLAATFPEITAAMATDQEAPKEPGGRRLVLCVVLRPGLALDRALTLRIKRELKQRASAVHVPAIILQVDDLPTTFSGKLSEAALQDALSRRPVRNLAALRNPRCVEEIASRVELDQT